VRLRGAEPNQYDPFGNLTVDEYSNAAEFPYRFSTKPQDPVTGLYYYGYRWYDPLTGRWPSRDPIGEEGGVNLYGFVGNDGVGAFDRLGLASRGKFTVVHKKGIPLNSFDALAVGKNYVDGFEVRYEPDAFDDKCCDSIKLVQAIKRPGKNSAVKKGTKIDCHDDYIQDHKNDPGGMPLPDYRDAGGEKGEDLDKYPHSYRDGPYDITQKKYTLTVCAFCHLEESDWFLAMDIMIGCVTFHFDQDTRRVWTDSCKSKPASSGEVGFEADATSGAGDVFNEALKNWGNAPELVSPTTPEGRLPL
jgi:RHS repeat-associated protein